MKKGLNKLPKQVYHSPTAHRLHTRVENIRHGANAALNGYVDFLEKGCLHVIDNAEKAGRDLRRHAMRMAYEAAVHVAEAGSGFVRAAGGVVAQGAEDAASSARKVTKKAGSRVRGAARKLNAASQNSLGRVKERVGSRKYEPVSGEPDWPEASGQGKQNGAVRISVCEAVELNWLLADSLIDCRAPAV
ncbi:MULTISPECIES: hypothetical protein [unclassified Rhizobacter]|nr:MULTISPECIES: hypothetical protein [unclassified Rhizobacter]